MMHGPAAVHVHVYRLTSLFYDADFGINVGVSDIRHNNRGYSWVKIESTESREPAVLAKRSSEPTKFLSCESRSALLTKE